MPPKAAPPRGRGRGRGRGGPTRGGASARPATETPAPQTDAQTTPAAPAEPDVIPDPAALPKIEDGANADAAVAATVEGASVDPVSVILVQRTQTNY
ncbi:hypothetical protein P171DRAFT_159011 [Karstenula rhodostoma CBS 690.94]|uniref:Uncharacterized protein n=1 Tax=Karstenula rhodostoma CBS 690.94 TaxID=1392251 RepID=A0A9P4P4R5_9PLEO|nr:hypothetical protein P171DRAFT_159011 [Karstenula rhodostoma CBS 690.94]